MFIIKASLKFCCREFTNFKRLPFLCKLNTILKISCLLSNLAFPHCRRTNLSEFCIQINTLLRISFSQDVLACNIKKSFYFSHSAILLFCHDVGMLIILAPSGPTVTVKGNQPLYLNAQNREI